jgi:hypothetical protein
MSTCSAAVIPFFSTCHVLPTLYQHLLQRLLHFSSYFSYSLHYVNMCSIGYFIFQHTSPITYNMSTYAAAVSPFFRNCFELPTVCQHGIQRLVHFSAMVSYYLHYVNMVCSGYFILQHLLRITYTLSTCAAAWNSFFRTGLVLPTICQHVLQRLITSFFSTGLILPTLCQKYAAAVISFSTLVIYFLVYVSICCSGYFIFENWSRITSSI